VTAWLRSIVTGEQSEEATTGELLVGEFLVDARMIAFGKTRKR